MCSLRIALGFIIVMDIVTYRGQINEASKVSCMEFLSSSMVWFNTDVMKADDSVQ